MTEKNKCLNIPSWAKSQKRYLEKVEARSAPKNQLGKRLSGSSIGRKKKLRKKGHLSQKRRWESYEAMGEVVTIEAMRGESGNRAMATS